MFWESQKRAWVCYRLQQLFPNLPKFLGFSVLSDTIRRNIKLLPVKVIGRNKTRSKKCWMNKVIVNLHKGEYKSVDGISFLGVYFFIFNLKKVCWIEFLLSLVRRDLLHFFSVHIVYFIIVTVWLAYCLKNALLYSMIYEWMREGERINETEVKNKSFLFKVETNQMLSWVV